MMDVRDGFVGKMVVEDEIRDMCTVTQRITVRQY